MNSLLINGIYKYVPYSNMPCTMSGKHYWPVLHPSSAKTIAITNPTFLTKPLLWNGYLVLSLNEGFTVFTSVEIGCVYLLWYYLTIYYISGRPVTCVHISPVQTHFLLIAYGAVTEKGKATSKVRLLIRTSPPLPPLPEVWSETANSYHLLPPGGNSSLPHINSLSSKPQASRLGSHLIWCMC